MHPLLKRQLAKLNMGTDSLPSTLSAWQEFLNKIDKSYCDADQGRHRIERALTLSSREMQDLYENLRSTSESQLKIERDKLKAVFDSIGEGLCTLDAAGRILSINPKGLEHLGLEGKDMKGTKLFETISLIDSNAPHATISWEDLLPDMKSGTSYVRDDWQFSTPSKQLTYLSVVLTPIIEEQCVTGAVLVFRDIHDRKMTELTIRKNEAQLRRQQEALLNLTKGTLLKGDDLTKSLHVLAKVCSEILDVDRVGIWFFTSDHVHIQCFCLFEKSSQEHSTGQKFPVAAFPRYFQELHSDTIISVSHAIEDPRTSEFRDFYLVPYGITSILHIPILIHGSLAGVLCSEHIGLNRQWTVQEETFAGSIANLCALALEAHERKRAEEQSRIMASVLESKNLELSEARDRALEVARAKTEFLATISHEVRTPLNGILGFTGILLDTSLTLNQREAAETVRSSANNLLGILNDILDFSKIEAGKMTLEPLDFDLRVSIEDVLELLGAQASAKGIELIGLVAAKTPTMVHGDSGRFRQILTNLVNNAIKFSEKGDVIVQVHLRDQTPTDLELLVEVMDKGIGIPMAVQERLFQPFTQADSSTTRRFGGTGLGLAICKQLVDLMGGRIGVDSQSGQGSRFWFTVRFGHAQNPEPTGSPLTTQLKGLNLCCVDGNEINQRLISLYAQEWGMSCSFASNGATALSLLQDSSPNQLKYDMAIIDLHLPDMDGLSLAQAIKADPSLRHIPLIVMTSVGKRGDALMAQRSGVDAYLTKPIRKNHLCAALATVIGKRVSQTTTPNPSIVTSFTVKEAARQQASRILVVDDYPINQKLAVLLLERQGHRVDVAANGKEAVEASSTVPYSLILMDCQMPVLDGYQATKEIRRREQGKRHTPIIAMTANAMKGDEAKCLDAGMDAYLPKPIQAEQLSSLLQQWLATSPSLVTRSACMTNDSNVPEPSTAMAMDREAWERIRALQRPGRPDVLAEFLTVFLNDSPLQVDSLRTAIAQRDTSTVYHAAHTLKSSCLFLGANRMAEICKELELMGRQGTLVDAQKSFTRLEAEFETVKDIVTSHLQSSSDT